MHLKTNYPAAAALSIIAIKGLAGSKSKQKFDAAKIIANYKIYASGWALFLCEASQARRYLEGGRGCLGLPNFWLKYGKMGQKV